MATQTDTSTSTHIRNRPSTEDDSMQQGVGKSLCACSSHSLSPLGFALLTIELLLLSGDRCGTRAVAVVAGARGPDGDAGARRRCGRLPPAPCSSSKATHRLRGSGTAATVGGGRYQAASQGGRYPAVSREGRGSDGFATMSGWLGSPEANASTHRRAARPR